MDTLPIALPFRFPKGPTCLALILLLMAGCAQVKPDQGQPGEKRPEDAYARSDLDELLDFGASLGSKPAPARAEVCRALLNRQREVPGTGVQGHVLTARLLSDACDDIPKILEGVDAIPLDGLPDERVRRLVSAQREALKRLQGLSKKLAVLEHKQKSLQSLLESKVAKTPSKARDAKDGEARLLRNKLEAIRAMEQKMDETGGGN
jgi:hypothetical protein